MTTALPQGDERVVLNPADFTADIDNPYRPMEPGTRLVEDTLDWYAQDNEGNI